MIYTIEVVKEVVQQAEVEGITLREALQKIVDLDDDIEWNDHLDFITVDREPTSGIIGVSYEGTTTKKEARELLKEAKEIWKDIS